MNPGAMYMTKHCETIEHTADAGLSARADSAEELFEVLAEGLAQFIGPSENVQPLEMRTVETAAEDLEALAVDFLWDVMSLIQIDRFVISKADVTFTGANAVRAELHGEPYQADRHEIHTEVKAVTYHQLKIAKEQGQWVGRVILDL